MVESKLIFGPKPILTNPTRNCDLDNPMDREVLESLLIEMKKHNGLGLSANQIGWPIRAFAIETGGAADADNIIVNPVITDWGIEKNEMEEGCLSFPGLILKIERPKKIVLEYHTINGEFKRKLFAGLTARIIQHEVDHLDGILFYNRAKRTEREMRLKKWRKHNAA